MARNPLRRAPPSSTHPSTRLSTAHSKPTTPHRIRHAIFTTFYRSTYSFLFILLLALLAITPGDHIYQTISNNRIGNVFVVAGVYIATALLTLFIYASRLYTNRVALAGIPRSYLPILKGEVGEKVRRIVEGNWRRSALVAWEGRPRDLGGEVEAAARVRRGRLSRQVLEEKHPLPHPPSRHTHGHQHTHPDEDTQHLLQMQSIPPINPADPPWGLIHHPGWSSPSHPTLPALHFGTVIAELPNLLEAQAVSCAPADAAFDFLQGADGAPDVAAPKDPDSVARLTRRVWMGMREYVIHLAELGVLDLEGGGDDDLEMFLRLYEYARYSVELLSEAESERLMGAFSRVLGRVRPASTFEKRDSGHVGGRGVELRARESFSSVLRRPASVSRTKSDRTVSSKGDKEREDAASFASSSGSVIHHDAG